MYALPSKRKAIAMALFSSISQVVTWLYTDFVGSAWCFVNAFCCLAFLADYLLFESGDEEPVEAAKV